MAQACEPVLVQALIPEAPVKRFDISVLIGLTRLDEEELNPTGVCPSEHGTAAEFLTVIGPDGFGQAASLRQLVEDARQMTGSGDPDYKRETILDRAPAKADELVLWLKKSPPERPFFHEDTWRDTCRKHLLNSLCALQQLAKEGVWPEHRWREALQVWGEVGRARRSWHHAAALFETMPNDVLLALARQVSWWLQEVSNTTVTDSDRLIRLCQRVLTLDIEPGSGIQRNGQPVDQPVTEAINHPVGHVTQALLNLWFQSELNDNDGLPEDLKGVLTVLCDTEVHRYRHGRVILSAHLISLFRVDRDWTERHLLPLFDWEQGALEARAAWEGFLWSPRLYLPLLKALKSALLQWEKFPPSDVW